MGRITPTSSSSKAKVPIPLGILTPYTVIFGSFGPTSRHCREATSRSVQPFCTLLTVMSNTQTHKPRSVQYLWQQTAFKHCAVARVVVICRNGHSSQSQASIYLISILLLLEWYWLHPVADNGGANAEEVHRARVPCLCPPQKCPFTWAIWNPI